MQNESEREFHRVYKVSPTQQLSKLTHLLRESGDFLHGDKEVAYSLYCYCLVSLYFTCSKSN